MGDIPPVSNTTGNYDANQEVSKNFQPAQLREDGSLASPQSASPPVVTPFQGQYQPIYSPPSDTFSGQLDMSLTQQGQGRQGPYDMSAVANALPQAGYRSHYHGQQQQPQRYAPVGPNMIPQMVQLPGQPHLSQLSNQQYYVPQHQQMPQFFGTQMAPASQQHQPHQVGASRGNMGMNYYPSSFMMPQSQGPVQGYYYPPSNHFMAHNPSIHNHLAQPHYFLPDASSGSSTGPSQPQKNSSAKGLGLYGPGEESTGNQPSIVRGPPRKPRQSGHAIWIGNLPPQTELMSLVHHVCKEAAGLESLFLISKSNCAFANFKDETTCTAAQQKIHDSKFYSVRLVSRLRKSTVEGASGQTAPTGPASASATVQSVSLDQTQSVSSNKSMDGSSTQEKVVGPNNTLAVDGNQQKDKFFILKSLTVEDLELSIRNGVWATQSHNEEALNKAFEIADHVYLIFSANKSGEYFGYARMTSPINHDPAAAIEFAPKVQPTNSMDLPKAIPTDASDTCPRGRIIDDSARGTIFWEAERDEVDAASDAVSEDSESAGGAHDGEGIPKAWGKPFQLEWLSTTRLPFYRTRGIRNPWNSHREVKIARDGTELEPNAGRRLIGLFNRVQSPVLATTAGVAGMAAGYATHVLPQFS